jgi:diacylglycerol kinase (ATP)
VPLLVASCHESTSSIPLLIIIFNPAAGPRRIRGLWRVLDVLIANGVRVELAETTHPGHATELAREAVRIGATLVVGAGGDGTIAEIANGLNGSDVRLGVIPLGTANVLAHELELPFAPRAVAAALAFVRTRSLFPGIAECSDSSRLFVQMLGVGFDAQVVHNVPLRMKRSFGRWAYVLQSLREVVRYPYLPIRLSLDGVPVEAASAIISKGRFYAGPYTLAPLATPGEPGFHVALFEWSGPAATMLYGAALPLDRLHRAPGLRLVQAQRVEFLGNSRIPAQADGDPAGHTPLTVTAAPSPLRIVVG